MNSEDTQLAPLDINSLDDLDNEIITIEVKRPGRRSIRVKFKPLSYLEWRRYDWEIPRPSPTSIKEYAHGGIPIYDENEPGYVQRLAESDSRRMYRRLIDSLQLPIPGDTVDDKIAALEKKFDYGTIRLLSTALAELAYGGETEIEQLADSFRPVATGDLPGGEPNGTHAASVVAASPA